MAVKPPSGKSCHWQFLVFASATGLPQSYGFHIAGSSVSMFLRCRNQVTPIRNADAPLWSLVSYTVASCDLKPLCRLSALLVEVGGVEPPSSTHSLQLLGFPYDHSLLADESHWWMLMVALPIRASNWALFPRVIHHHGCGLLGTLLLIGLSEKSTCVMTSSLRGVSVFACPAPQLSIGVVPTSLTGRYTRRIALLGRVIALVLRTITAVDCSGWWHNPVSLLPHSEAD